MTFYGRSISVQNQLTSRLGDLYFWIALRYDLSENVTVLRYTLFSHVPAEFEDRVGIGLKDFHYIDKWTVTDHNVAQKADLSWLNEQVVSISQNVPERKIVIFTHHSPITWDQRAVDPAHVGSPIGSRFASDLSEEACWKAANARLWAFGHTHYNCDFVIKDDAGKGHGKKSCVQLAGNYFKRAANFDVEKVVDV